MSLLFVDIAYLGLKGLGYTGYYAAKYSYNFVYHMLGGEAEVERTVETPQETILNQLVDLRMEIQDLKKDRVSKQEKRLLDSLHIDNPRLSRTQNGLDPNYSTTL